MSCANAEDWNRSPAIFRMYPWRLGVAYDVPFALTAQRIFNTLTQSEKCDPNGDYIRYWVPELKNLKGKTVHDPFHNMPKNEFQKLGYPAPIVDHKQSRERALFRYKNVGEKEA